MTTLQNIAVTGCQGFIGQHLTRDLRDAGFTVRGLARSAATQADDMQIAYDAAGFAEGLRGMDAVVHLAGRRMTREDDPQDLAPFLQPNVAMVGDLVTACLEAGVKRIILASTIAVYPRAAAAPYSVHDTRPQPINAYALSKLMAESYLEMRCRDNGPSAVSLRIAATYGLGEKGTPVLMRFINQASRNETLVLTGNPAFEVDQIYVKDVTGAVIAALHDGQAQGVLNLGAGQGVSVLEMAETVNAVFGQEGNLDMANTQIKPAPKAHMDISETCRLLNWTPQFSLADGLGDMRRQMLGIVSAPNRKGI